MPQAQATGIAGFIPILIIFAIFYFLLIRPQQDQRKKHEQMINNLKKNDDVITIGGIHGTIVNLKEKTIILRVDDNTRIEIDKSAISTVKEKNA